jgi:hypothetical protein
LFATFSQIIFANLSSAGSSLASAKNQMKLQKKNKIESVNKRLSTVNGKEIPTGKTYRQNFMRKIENINNRFVSPKNTPQNRTSRDR